MLREPDTANGHFDSFVDDAGINVMAAGHTRMRVYGQIPGGEHILPALFLGGGGILPSQSVRQVHLAMPLSQILLMQRLDPGQVVLEQRGQGGGSDVCVYGEVGQERFDLGFGGEEVLTGPHAVETNKPHDPVHVGSLGVNGVVVQTEYLSDLIEEFWLLTFCRVRHIRLP